MLWEGNAEFSPRGLSPGFRGQMLDVQVQPHAFLLLPVLIDTECSLLSLEAVGLKKTPRFPKTRPSVCNNLSEVTCVCFHRYWPFCLWQASIFRNSPKPVQSSCQHGSLVGHFFYLLNKRIINIVFRDAWGVEPGTRMPSSLSWLPDQKE